MENEVAHLAYYRNIVAERKASLIKAEAELHASPLWQRVGDRHESLNRAKGKQADAEAGVRKAAMKIFTETDNRAPHPAVKIKMFTVLEYKDEDAINYAREHLPGALKLDKRIFKKAALAGCGIAGIRDKFDGLADAIQQMSEYVKEIDAEHDKLRDELARAKGESGTLEQGVERADYVHEKPLDEVAQALRAERQLRQEAEHELVMAEDLLKVIRQRADKRLEEAEHSVEDFKLAMIGTHAALDECQIKRNFDDGGIAASARTRILWLNQRAEMLEQEGNRWRGDWESVTAELLNIRDRLAEAEQRAERAESLAALVTLGLPVLLTRLASCASAVAADYEGTPEGQMVAGDARAARELAAQIRKALDDNQA